MFKPSPRIQLVLLAIFLAAFLTAQLGSFAAIQLQRMKIWTRYERELSDLAAQRGWQLLFVPAHVTHPAHLFWLQVDSLSERQALLGHLDAHGIHAVFHYVPLHSAPMGRQFGKLELPVTCSVADRLVRLPLYPDLTDEDVNRVVTSISAFRP